MSNTISRIVALAGAVAVSAAALAADDAYVIPSVVYTMADDNRLVDDAVSGGQLNAGKYLTDHFAIEALLGVHDMSGTDSFGLTEFGLNGVWAWRRDAGVSPYILGGIGRLSADSGLFGSDHATYFTYGAGLNFGLGDGPLGARLEYRVRDSQEDSRDPDDHLISLGLTFGFGKKETPMPVAMADPDTDGDGVPDSRDNCANTPAGHAVDRYGCSLDSDGDGVADANDQCPNTVAGAAVNAVGCELDDDQDGVVNRLDQCPNTAKGVRVDVNGCEIRDIIELPGVNFETNSDRLLPGADDVLTDAAATLRKYPELVVEVAGHTDSAGAADYNQGLSERRAATVRDYLINAGAGEANLSARGYGESRPIADNATREGRARNRRVELRIIERE